MALLYLSGAHLVVVQCVAWGGMVVSYSQDVGLQKGLSNTFDGKHPCGMCKKVQQAKRDHAPLALAFKLTDLKAVALDLRVPATQQLFSESTDFCSSVSFLCGVGLQSPPVPPPRA